MAAKKSPQGEGAQVQETDDGDTQSGRSGLTTTSNVFNTPSDAEQDGVPRTPAEAAVQDPEEKFAQELRGAGATVVEHRDQVIDFGTTVVGEDEGTVEIRVNEDLPDTTIGPNTYNFQRGLKYRVPASVAEHLEEKGRVWH